MGRFDEYRALVSLVQTGSIRGAANQTGLSRSSVTRYLERLEERVGAPLLLSDGQTTRPTPLGLQLADHAAELLDAAEEMERLASSQQSDVLTVAMVPTSGRPQLAEMVGAFCAKHPEVQLTIVTGAHVANLQEEKIDVAFRPRPGDVPELIASPILELRKSAWVSEPYASEFGLPDSVEAAVEHALLLPLDLGLCPQWTLDPRFQVQLRSNDFGLLESATHTGSGIGILPELKGRVRPGLVPVLPGLAPGWLMIHAVFTEKLRKDTRVRALVDFARKWFRPDAL